MEDECVRCENLIGHLTERIHALEYVVNKLEHVNGELTEELHKLHHDNWSVEL